MKTSRRNLEPVPWAPGWTHGGPFSRWIERADGLELYVYCNMLDPAAKPAFQVCLAADPAFARYGADSAFGEEGCIVIEAATPAEAIAEIDRRWPLVNDAEEHE